MIGVLFVCLGNICRSPMAEGIFADLVAQAGLDDQFKIDSAGTSGYHVGDMAHRGTRQILANHHIRYEGRSRQISGADLDVFDYIIAMDSDNLANLHHLNSAKDPQTKLHKLLTFAQNSTVRDVPDPYYTGNFDDVYTLVLDGCQGLLNHIITEHQLG